MKLIDTSIKRPVFTVMIYVAILILGFTGLSKLSIDFLPEIEFPAIVILTQQPGVGPQEIESSITRVIEGAVASAEGIDRLTATSREGLSAVTVLFKWGKNLDAAVADLRDKIDLVIDRLPDDASKPTLFRISTSNIPIMFLGLVGEKPLPFLFELADQKLKDQIVQVPGIATVNIEGQRKREVQVVLNRNRLYAYGLTPDQIINVLRAENINSSGGTIKSGYSQFTIRTEGEFKNVDDVRNIIVTYQRGIPVYLRYVADVNWGISEEVSTSRFNSKPGLRLVVYKQSGANTVQAVDSLRAKLERIRAELPAGVQLLEAFSSADFTRNSIGNTASSAILGGILAVIIVLIFLRNIRASMIIGLAIPTSIIATFIGMYFFKVNLNMISLGGLTLGIGMLVDNAIIVLENTFNYMSRGAKPAEAARLGAQEIAGAIFASTLTTVCVFLPIVFTDGMAKEIFKDMALTVSFSLMASIFVAITLVPMLSAKYLRFHDEKELKKLEPRLYKIVNFGERILEYLESRYKEGIRWALSNRKKLLIAVVGIFLFTMMVVMRGVDSEFFPESDQASIKVTVTMPVGTRLETTNEAVEQMIGLLKKAVPEKYIRNVFFVSGSPGGFSAIFNASGSHVSTLQARLVSKSERDKTTTEYIKTLKDLVQKAPAPLGVAAVNISGRGAPGFGDGSPIDILVRGYDLKKGAEIAKQLKTIMEKVPGLYNIDVSRKEGAPEMSIRVNRVKAASLGINMASIATTIQQSVLGRTATYLREGGREYDVLVRLDEKDRKSIEDIENIQVLSGYTRRPVRIGNIASVVRDVGPINIERDDQERVIHVTCSSFRGLQQSVDDIQAEVKKKIVLPAGFSLEYKGNFKDMQDTFGDLILAVMVAIALVYAVMASIFESYLDPFIIFFTIPLSLIGVIWMLFLAGTSLNVNSMIGILVLAGVVVNNGIVLVDYINILRARGYKLEEAIMEGGRRRLRPILMTTLTTVIALVPGAIGMGEGDEANIPLARTVIGGLTVSTFLSLFIVPTIYLSFDHIFERRRKKREGRVPLIRRIGHLLVSLIFREKKR